MMHKRSLLHLKEIQIIELKIIIKNDFLHIFHFTNYSVNEEEKIFRKLNWHCVKLNERTKSQRVVQTHLTNLCEQFILKKNFVLLIFFINIIILLKCIIIYRLVRIFSHKK